MMTSKYNAGHAMKVLTKILTHEYSNKKALMFMVGYSDQHWEKCIDILFLLLLRRLFNGCSISHTQ